MPATTYRYGIDYPLQTDSTDVPGDIETPMNQIDAIITGTFSGILASLPAFGIMGRRYYATDTGNIYFDTGSGWLNEGPINTVLGNIAALNPGSMAAVGTTGFSADAGHEHLLPGWGSSSDYQAASGSGSAGATGRFADAGHVHPGDPAGVIKEYGGTTTPTGFVKCDGSAYSTSTYPALFAAIGYQWGGSSGTFHVPNMVDRSPIGAGNSYTVGQLGGVTQVTLTANMLAAHFHSISDGGHAHSSNDNGNASYQTIYTSPLDLQGQISPGAGSLSIGFGAGGMTGTATTGITNTNYSAAATSAVPVTHPVAGVLYIIRAY